jgi:hypothetical protein
MWRMWRSGEPSSTPGWSAALLAVAVLGLPACSSVSTEQDAGLAGEPAKVRAVGDSGLSEVTLTARAVERVGVRTVVAERLGGSRITIPYSAVLYDANGVTWAFVRTAPRTFIRQRIDVVRIDGDVAVLSAGPNGDTEVVSVGAAELYGAELGVDH